MPVARSLKDHLRVLPTTLIYFSFAFHTPVGWGMSGLKRTEKTFVFLTNPSDF